MTITARDLQALRQRLAAAETSAQRAEAAEAAHRQEKDVAERELRDLGFPTDLNKAKIEVDSLVDEIEAALDGLGL